MKRAIFTNLLQKLYFQSGQEKLRIAFKLSQFVKQLRAQGDLYVNKKSAIRSRTIA